MNIMRCKEVGKRAGLVDSRLLGKALAGWWTMALVDDGWSDS